MSGTSKARLGRMNKAMAGYVERGEVPGIVALVSRKGDVRVDLVGKKSIGGDPVQRDTIFRISSMTKPITAVATMILVEECKLRLDEPVDRLLPELADRRVLKQLDGPLDDTVPANRPITVRDLLTFRLGFGILMAPPGAYPIQRAVDDLKLGQGPPAPSIPPGPDEWIRRLGTLPLMHQPGEEWMYNTGADILGVTIARASGQPLETFLRERIFGPLGMKDTGFSVPPNKIGRLVTSYWVDYKTGTREVYDPAVGGQWSKPPAFPSGAGGLVSTVDDYYAFARMLLNKGEHEGERILSRPSVELMTTDQLTEELYGTVGRYGWDGGMGTSWANDPRQHMIGILMTNQMWNSPSPPGVCLDFWTSAYQAIDD
jgi:CubicO group peptidase (beta-lactamase class C family)